jgi:hypothetical protein
MECPKRVFLSTVVPLAGGSSAGCDAAQYGHAVPSANVRPHVAQAFGAGPRSGRPPWWDATANLDDEGGDASGSRGSDIRAVLARLPRRPPPQQLLRFDRGYDVST